jgi:hypothetical protein
MLTCQTLIEEGGFSMKLITSLGSTLGLLLVILFASACNAEPAAVPATIAPTAVAIAATPTSPPATDTPIPPTDTLVPPTETPTMTPTQTATELPTETPTSVRSPTATPVPPTATRKPTAAPTAVPQLVTVDWKTGMEYNNRDGSSFWCQMHNQYHNNSPEDLKFQEGKTMVYPGATPPNTYSGYGPIFGVANPDGSIKQWRVAGWYSKMLGWPNGIPGWPYDIKAGTVSDDWTWYSDAQRNGEYCRYVYVKWRGQVSAAEYSPKGDIVSTNSALPPGAP